MRRRVFWRTLATLWCRVLLFVLLFWLAAALLSAASAAEVKLAWDAPAITTGITEYRVYRGAAAGAYTTYTAVPFPTATLTVTSCRWWCTRSTGPRRAHQRCGSRRRRR